MRTIAIDYELHRLIEARRTSTDESANGVLRRLLGLSTKAAEAPAASVPESGWCVEGVWLPDGTELAMSYGGRKHEGRIEQGAWQVEGKRFRSPSGAASGVAVTRNGTHPRLDGWLYWHVLLPGADEWISLLELRSRAARVGAS